MREPVTRAFSATIWLYPGKGGWHFVTLPKSVAAQVRFLEPERSRLVLATRYCDCREDAVAHFDLPRQRFRLISFAHKVGDA